MWKPATRQITGTNDGQYISLTFHRSDLFLTRCVVPLGQRRRFGPAPADDAPAPQLAQPSPSAYPRSYQDESPGKRGRDESPVNGDPKSKQTENSLA